MPVQNKGVLSEHRVEKYIDFRCNTGVRYMYIQIYKTKDCKMIKINTFFNTFLKIADQEKQTNLKKKNYKTYNSKYDS